MQKKNWLHRKYSIFNGIPVHRKAGNILHTLKSHDLAGGKDKQFKSCHFVQTQDKNLQVLKPPLFSASPLEEPRHPGKWFQVNLTSELFFQSCQKGGIHKSLRAPRRLANAQGSQAGCQGARKPGLPRSQQANWLKTRRFWRLPGFPCDVFKINTVSRNMSVNRQTQMHKCVVLNCWSFFVTWQVFVSPPFLGAAEGRPVQRTELLQKVQKPLRFLLKS